MSNARDLARVDVNTSGEIAAANLANAVPADGSITAAKLAAGAAVSNIGYTPADNASLGSLATVTPTGTASSSTFLAGDGSWKSAGGAGGAQVFTTSGTFTIPDGVTSLKVTVVGGGGGGGYISTGYNSSGGGGSGGVAIEYLSGLTPGDSVSVTVGAGGNYVSSGGTSSFGAYCSATGGGAAPANASKQGGSAGSATGGTFNYPGNGGGSGGTNGCCLWGGNGGAPRIDFGGYAGYGTSSCGGGGTNGTAGTMPGSGGGGASRWTSTYYGASGTNGLVLVEW